MSEIKKTVKMLGQDFIVSEVPIVEMREDFNDYKLEDGTILKVKGAVSSIMRIEGQYLPDGSPVYFALLAPVVKVESSAIKGETQEVPPPAKAD
jgi:hypothetical protein